ncbi:MAG: phosphotransferase [Castellaniella sp.]
MSSDTVARPDRALEEFLVTQGLADAQTPAQWTALTGGVSSDIWRVCLPGQTLCVKRALPQLKVAREWLAPITRNAYEWAWLCFAAARLPQAVPRPIAHDAEQGILAMAYLDVDSHPVWKQQLLEGRIDPRMAHTVADLLGQLHSASAHDPECAPQFQSSDIFYPIRLEPYLVATGEAHPDLAPTLQALVERTLATRLALVHGDISPKNILAGPQSPIFLDAECAWFGDPAFDLAFCLNHFLLKCLVHRDRRRDYLHCFADFTQAYLQRVDWEAPQALESRAAALLPGLFLARIDGKSPIEYVTREADKALVRRVARPLILTPPPRLAEIARIWDGALADT